MNFLGSFWNAECTAGFQHGQHSLSALLLLLLLLLRLRHGRSGGLQHDQAKHATAMISYFTESPDKGHD